MTIDDRIGDEELQYDINREAAKISALFSGKIDRYEYPTGEEIMSSDQSRIIEQVKFTFLLSVKHLRDKNDWRSRRKINKGTWTWRAWKITSWV